MKADKQVKIIGFLLAVMFLYYVLYVSGTASKQKKKTKYLKQKRVELKGKIRSVNSALEQKGFDIQFKETADAKIITAIMNSIEQKKQQVESQKLDIKPFMVNKNDILTVIENLTVVPNVKDLNVDFISFSENKILKVINNESVYYQYTAPIKLRADFKHFFKYIGYLNSFNKLFIIDNFVLSYNSNVEYLSANFKLKFFINQEPDKQYRIEPSILEAFTGIELNNISKLIYTRKKKTVLKRTWNMPVLEITGYEAPDIDGKYALSWFEEREVEYTLLENGKEIKDPENPYSIETEENGRYIYKVRGNTYDDQVIESRDLEVIVDIEPVELPMLQGIVSFNGKHTALIENKRYRVNDEIGDFKIEKISEQKVFLEFKEKKYEITLPEIK